MKEKMNPESGRVKFPIEPMEIGDMRLFPDDNTANAASSTECTGLVQVSPADDDVMDAYAQVYSYRQHSPIVNIDKDQCE